MTEFALAYGPPDPDMPWPLFLLLARATDKAAARELHSTMIGTAWGAQKALLGQHLQLESAERRVRETAYGR